MLGILFPVLPTQAYNPLHEGKLLNGAFEFPHWFLKAGNVILPYYNDRY